MATFCPFLLEVVPSLAYRTVMVYFVADCSPTIVVLIVGSK